MGIRGGESSGELDAQVERLAARIRGAHRAVALTGAGVSTDSGIPDFRSAGSGLWDEHDPMEVASIGGFHSDPRRFYDFWAARFRGLATAQPNVAHHALAALEQAGLLRAVVTQNIDGLHRRAGSREVLEVHGTYTHSRCLNCGATGDLEEVVQLVERGSSPSCELCGGLVKPDVVLFGEQLPATFRKGERLAEEADLVIVLGSSLEVHPVAGLVPLALETGAEVVIINRDESAMDHLATQLVRAELGAAMERLARRLELPLMEAT